MAKFSFSVIKIGKEGEELRETVSISYIEPEEGEKIIEIPSHFEGKPVTHIGYIQGKEEGEMRYHDWHHPGQGFDGYEPGRFYAKESCLFEFPRGIKKMIIPAEIECLSPRAYCNSKYITYEIAPENRFFRAEGHKIFRKKQ